MANRLLQDALVKPWIADGAKVLVNPQTGTTYTVTSDDSGKLVSLANASPVTLTLPNNLPVGWNVSLAQLGAGQVSLVPASGAFLRNRQGYSKLAGQYAGGSLVVVANAGGSAAEYLFTADGAA